MRIFLIRHGETLWTATRRYQGTTNVPLTRGGIRQAKAIARALESERPTRLYTSTLRRARDTAARMARSLGLKPLIDSRLNEIDFGEWEGADYRILAQRSKKEFRAWREGRLKKPPGGESIASLSRRIGEFLKEILDRYPEETLAIVSHGGPIKMFLFKALNGFVRRTAPFPSVWSLRIDPGSISLIEGNQSLLQIVWTNRLDHLNSK